MKQTGIIGIFLILAIITASCANALPASQGDPTNTSPLILGHPTSTPLSTTAVKAQTSLFSGPGHQGYKTLEELSGGTVVIPIAVFGSYTKIQDLSSKQEGFVATNDLLPLAEALPSLTVTEVPWIEKDLMDYCAMPFAQIVSGQLVITNSTNDWIGVSGGNIRLMGPAKVQIGLSMNNDHNGQISFSKPFDFPTQNEDWYKTTHFYLRVINHAYSIVIYDGRSLDSTYTQDLPYNDTQILDISFLDPEGKQITISDGSGNAPTSIDVTGLPGLSLAEGLFPGKTMNIGCELDAKSALTMGQHKVELAPSGVVEAASAEIPELGELASQHGITLGAAIDWWLLADPAQKNVAQKTFDLTELTAFGDPTYWQGPGKYNFAFMDPVIDYLLEQGWKIRALHLVYGDLGTLPDWLKNGNYTRDEYIGFLESFVKDNMAHYKGKITEYSLANEALNAFGSQNDFWANKIGWDYVDRVFRWAFEADPDAILILNADNNECIRDDNTRTQVERTVAWVQRMKNNGVPIDAIGMEMHLLLPWNSTTLPDKSCLIETMNRYGSLGVSVDITELDVNTARLQGTEEEILRAEGDIYQTVMDACLESNACKSIATFGVTDKQSWLFSIPEISADMTQGQILAPLLFDKNSLPKPAFYGILKSLQFH